MEDKKLLFDELYALMQENGIEPRLLKLMQDPEWLETVTVENLNFLLEKHRSLKAQRTKNEGLYARWMKAREKSP